MCLPDLQKMIAFFHNAICLADSSAMHFGCFHTRQTLYNTLYTKGAVRHFSEAGVDFFMKIFAWTDTVERAVKSIIAIFLCMLFFDLTGWGRPFYAVIAVVICLKPTVQSSLTMGRNRTIGTLLGGAAGLLCMALLLQIGLSYRIFVLPLFVGILLWLCDQWHLMDSANIACIVLCVTLLNHDTEGLMAYTYVLSRTFETLVGVGISLLVNGGFHFLRKRLQAHRERAAVPSSTQHPAA